MADEGAAQNAIAENKAEPLSLPKFPTYCICNLRGGIGKTSLAFNLSYLVENLLAVDTCPQGNLSYFYAYLFLFVAGVSLKSLVP